MLEDKKTLYICWKFEVTEQKYTDIATENWLRIAEDIVKKSAILFHKQECLYIGLQPNWKSTKDSTNYEILLALNH